jgi:hypothetical protein
MSKTRKVKAVLVEPSEPNFYESGDGAGSTVAVSIGRAVDELMAKPYVKGKRPRQMTLLVTVLE